MKGRKVQEDIELRNYRQSFARNRKLLVPIICAQVCLLCIQVSCLDPYKPLILYTALHSIAVALFEYWADVDNYQLFKLRHQLREFLTMGACAVGYYICTSRISPENEALMAFVSLVLLPMLLVVLSEEFSPLLQVMLVLHFAMACTRFWEEIWGRGGQQIFGMLAFDALLFKVGMDRTDMSRSNELTGSVFSTLSFMLSIMSDGFLVLNKSEKIIGANEGIDVCLGTNSGPDGSELDGKYFRTVFDGTQPRLGLNTIWFKRPDSKRIKLELYTLPCRLSADGVTEILECQPWKGKATQEQGASICAIRIVEEEKTKAPEPEPAPAPAHQISNLTQLKSDLVLGLEGAGRQLGLDSVRRQPPAAAPANDAGFAMASGSLMRLPQAEASPTAATKTFAPLFFKSPWRFEPLEAGALAAESLYRKVEVPGGEGIRGGWVCKAKNSHGERVAVKEISLAAMRCQKDFPVHLKAISREADALKKISWASPVVIRLQDCWLQNDFNKACLVTEWLPHTLQGILAKFRRDKMVSVQKQDARRWFTQMVAGVAAIHAAGYVHRDIEPSNIWLTEDHQRCKIAGLGITRPLHRKSAYSKSRRENFGTLGMLGSNDTDDTESAVGSVISNMSEDNDTGSMVSGLSAMTGMTSMNGMNAYSSPEMIRDHRYSQTTDIFSLGCILLELLTLAPLSDLGIALQEESPEEVAWSLVADARVQCFEVGDVQNLSVNTTDLPGLVVSLLSLDPTARPDASDIISRSARLQTFLPDLLEESPKLRGVLLKRQRRVHFNHGMRGQERDGSEGGGSGDASGSELMPAVA